MTHLEYKEILIETLKYVTDTDKVPPISRQQFVS